MSASAEKLESAAGTDHGARVPPLPPPLYYAAAFVAGTLLDRAVPLPVGGRPATAIVGVTVLVAGALLGGAGVSAIIRKKTTIVPHRPVSALVTDGVYQFSRNPMYTGLGVAYVGGALLAGSWWPVALLPLVLVAVRRLVIDPEERYLNRRFGQGYADYRARVRRWL